MKTQPAEAHVTHLFRYVIASADMYYAEEEQRDIFLGCDEQGNFRIWGEITDEGPSTTIDLFEIFLEYALYCGSWSCAEESLYHMQDFGECLGRALAKYIKSAIPPSTPKNMAVQALKHILKTMDGYPSIENGGNEVRFIVPDFPLEKAAEHCGLRNVELAHYGLNAMCQSLIKGLNPHLTLSASSETRPEFIFTISTPSFA